MYKHSEKTKEKIRAAVTGSNNGMYGKKMTIESRKKMSESHRGKKMKERTDEHRSNISKSLTGRRLDKKHINAILEGRKKGNSKRGNKIIAKSDFEILEFISIEKAAKYFNCSRNRITRNQVKNFNIEIQKQHAIV